MDPAEQAALAQERAALEAEQAELDAQLTAFNERRPRDQAAYLALLEELVRHRLKLTTWLERYKRAAQGKG